MKKKPAKIRPRQLLFLTVVHFLQLIIFFSLTLFSLFTNLSSIFFRYFHHRPSHYIVSSFIIIIIIYSQDHFVESVVVWGEQLTFTRL